MFNETPAEQRALDVYEYFPRAYVLNGQYQTVKLLKIGFERTAFDPSTTQQIWPVTFALPKPANQVGVCLLCRIERDGRRVSRSVAEDCRRQFSNYDCATLDNT